MNKEILIIGRGYSKEGSVNGPSGVIKAIVEEFQKKNIKFDSLIFDTEQISKLKFLWKVVTKILFSEGIIVNIHTEGYMIPFIGFLAGKLNRRNKYYLTVHGLHIMQKKYVNSTKGDLTSLLEKILLRKFDNIICVSQKLKNDLDLYFKRENNVYVINNGVNIFEFPFTEKKLMSDIKLIITGGVKRIKGIFEALRVIKDINESQNDFKLFLDVYGGVDDESTLNTFKKKINDYNIGRFVTYKGLIKEKVELYQKYEEADFNLCISHYDTFNVSALESMVVGTPTIVSKQCGASFLIKNFEAGFIVDVNDNKLSEIIEDIIKEMKDNQVQFNAIRRNSNLSVKSYTWEETASQYLDLFNDWEMN